MRTIERAYGNALVLDEHAFARRLVTSNLCTIGFRGIVTAQNAQIALDIIAAGRVDLVMLDWEIGPGSGGPAEALIPAIHEIADEERRPAIICVLRKPSRDHTVRAARVGADGVVTHPFSSRTLNERIDRSLERLGILPPELGPDARRQA